MKNHRLRKGDRVQVLRVPPGIVDDEEFKTKTILTLCLGKTFKIRGFQRGWLELCVGRVVGKPRWFHTIWIEPKHVRFVRSAKPPLSN